MTSSSRVPVDLAIIVALKEEFRVLARHFELHPMERPDHSGYDYLFELFDENDQVYECVAVLIDDMGPGHAADTVHCLLEKCEPAVLINIGIAASLHPHDVKLGDLVIVDQANDYLTKSKATPQGDDEWQLDLGGDSSLMLHSVRQREPDTWPRIPAEQRRWRRSKGRAGPAVA